jgi:hypothetical protein
VAVKTFTEKRGKYAAAKALMSAGCRSFFASQACGEAFTSARRTDGVSIGSARFLVENGGLAVAQLVGDVAPRRNPRPSS